MSTIYAWPYLKRPRQSTTVHIFCTACEWPAIVDASTNQDYQAATRASTSVVFTPGQPPAFTCFTISISVKYLNALI